MTKGRRALCNGILVSTHLCVEAADRDSFLAAICRDMDLIGQRSGCIYFAFTQALGSPLRFHLTQAWADREDYLAHELSPACQAALDFTCERTEILRRTGISFAAVGHTGRNRTAIEPKAPPPSLPMLSLDVPSLGGLRVHYPGQLAKPFFVLPKAHAATHESARPVAVAPLVIE